MKDFLEIVAAIAFIGALIGGIVFGAVQLSEYDTRETLKINNDRCMIIAADAGSNGWRTNYSGECYYIKDGKLQKVDVN